jgi:hypothetical protein
LRARSELEHRVSRRTTANRNISFPTLNRGHVLCYVVALARGRFWARSDKVPMVRGFGIEDDSGEGARVERRRSAVVEIRKHLAGLYRGFVWWTSLYGEVNDHYERERRELVVGLHEELSNQYLPRSVWLSEGAARRSRISSGCRKSCVPSSPRR